MMRTPHLCEASDAGRGSARSTTLVAEEIAREVATMENAELDPAQQLMARRYH